MQTIFPTSYFGNLEYFRLLCKVQDPLIETREHFIKQSIRTRCKILGSNGELMLSVPVIKPLGSKTPLDQILVSDDPTWRKEHWRSIYSAYAAAPYFEHYEMDVKSLIFSDFRNLIDLNSAITKSIIQWLSLPVNLVYTTSFESKYDLDYRHYNFERHEKVAPYIQVFPFDQSCNSSLSILDLLFCEGPLSRNWIIF
jgi:hypothetical protein